MWPPLVEKPADQSRAGLACSRAPQVVPLAPLARQPIGADLGADVLERFLAVNGPLCVRAEILDMIDSINARLKAPLLSVTVPMSAHCGATHGYRRNRQRSDECRRCHRREIFAETPGSIAIESRSTGLSRTAAVAADGVARAQSLPRDRHVGRYPLISIAKKIQTLICRVAASASEGDPFTRWSSRLPNEVVYTAHFRVTYWADHAVKEVRIMDVRRF